jgi:hypothetical protein
VAASSSVRERRVRRFGMGVLLAGSRLSYSELPGCTTKCVVPQIR